MGRIFGRFFSDLIAGDTTAWVVAAIIGGVFGLFCLFWAKVAHDLRREDEADRRKRARKRQL
jgi:hypothetical protein